MSTGTTAPVPDATANPQAGTPVTASDPETSDTEARIAAILADRRRLLPGVRAESARWQAVDEQLAALAVAVEALRTHSTTPAELREALVLPFAQAREGAGEAVRLLRVLEARLARDTVNIGVSGQARVGKSTLLQSVSGLGDDQIPTGQALPVTAVRSRIFHAPDLRRATLRLHSFDTFVTDVVAPYHAELDIAGLPGTPEEFRHWPYPKPDDAPSQPPGSPAASRDAADRPSWVTMLNRLRAMQQSFPTYEHDLTGGERVLPLEELRPWVAYPTNAEEQQPGLVARRYLAVRDVRIDCPFPHAQVRHLGIVDLPGLGEFAARADEHHVGGLQNEVDVVLLVKRPVEGMAYWGDADARALDLIDSARGFVDRRDFVVLVLNTGDTSDALLTALRDHIRGQVNSGVPDQFFQVLECDAADAGDVFARRSGPRAGAPRGPDAGDGRRRGGRHPGRVARRRPADRDAHRRRGAGAGVGGAVVRERGGGSRPAVAAAAPGPVGGARRAGRRAARAGPGGRGGPGLHRRRGAGVRDDARVDHGRARDRRAGVARRGAARHDGGPQQQPLRRRRAEPGPGGDQQLFRGDRRLLRRAGAGALGSGRGDHPERHGRAARGSGR